MVSREGLKRAGWMIASLAGAILAGQAISLVMDGKGVPAPVVLQALVFGGLNALVAVGLVLVYRASRIINFAQVAFGGVGGTLFFLLIELEGWPYWAAVGAGLGTAAALGAVVEVFFVRRFYKSPRLVLTVVTLGIASLLTFVRVGGLRLLFGLAPDDEVTGRPQTPFSDLEFEWFPVRFTGDHVVLGVVVALALGGLAAFFRFTSVGVAIRGAAENDDRASLLGVNVRNLSTLVWVVTAFLSGLAAVTQLPITGGGLVSGASAGFGAGLLLRALAAGVLGRMENLPMTVVAALGIAVFEQSVFWAVGQTSIVDAVMLAVIIGALLAQRRQIARSEAGEVSTWSATEEVRPIPAELASLPSVKRGVGWFVGIVALAVLAFPWLMSPSQTNLGSVFVIFGIVAVSLVILTGWGGQISLGQFAFVAVGGVVGGAITSRLDWPFLVATLVACATGGAVAVVLGLPALRIRGLFLAVTTLGFSIATVTVLLNEQFFGWLLPGQIRRPTFLFIDTEDERSFFYLAVVCLILTVLAVQGLRKTRTGRALIAMRDNERAAQSFGLNLVRIRLATFAISGFLAAFAGVLFAHHQHAVDPQSFGPDQSINMFLMAVIGGLGSVSGVLLGAAYMGAINIFASGPFQLFATGLGVLVVLLFLPGGLGSLVFRMRDSLLRRTAIRHRIAVPSLLGDRQLAAGEVARVPLAPLVGHDAEEIDVPIRYTLPSRIRTAGASQRQRTWRY